MAEGLSATPKSASTSLASPKLARNKSTTVLSGNAANVFFGCDHIQAFNRAGEKNWKTFEQFYIKTLQTLQDEHSMVAQTYRSGKTTYQTSLRPTWLCVQCPFIFSDEGREKHWKGPKTHSFFVDSRSGSLFCTNCDDFVYDPRFEKLRMCGPKKRKYEEYNNPDDGRYVPANSSHVPCRAIGLRGLYNMGNTCFMSVVLQSLIHNPFIRAFYLSEGHRPPECTENCTSCALDEIFVEFYSTEKTEGYGAVSMLLNSWKNAEASNNNELAGYQQQDAHEYMQFILNSLHSANGGSSASECHCIIHKTFYGKLRSTVTCDQCKNRTIVVDPFMDLSLDLRSQVKKRKQNGDAKTSDDRDAIRLEDCLKRFTSPEKLQSTEYFCRKCNAQRDASKQLSVQTLPPVLSIHLKRFSHNKDKSSKLETPVSFPLLLDMALYTTLYTAPETLPKPGLKKSKSKDDDDDDDDEDDDDDDDDDDDEPASTSEAPASESYATLLNLPKNEWPLNLLSYTLSAVIVHKGEINSGHYVSYAREGKDWFLFDDSKVVLVNEAEVLDAEAYLLLYVIDDVARWVED